MELTNSELLARDQRFLFGICALFFLAMCVIHPQGGHVSDLNCWVDWTVHLKQNGFSNAYTESPINYNPGFLYVLSGFGKLINNHEDVRQHIHLLRLIVLLFDIAGVALAAFIFRKQGLSPMLAVFILFNIGYLYNTVVWGQTDSMPTFFAAAALAAALYRKPVLSVVLLVVSLNVKLQAIIFLPLLGVLLLPLYFKSPKALVTSFVAAILVQAAFVMPFVVSGQLLELWRVVTGAVDYYAVVSMNAYNLWFLLLDSDLLRTPDSITVLGISYKQWGLLLFCFFSALFLMPVLLASAARFLKKQNFSTAEVAGTFLSASLIAIGFFYFNTQMHERYSHPAVLMAAIYAFLVRDYFFMVIVSLAYLLNMEAVLEFLHLYDHPTLIFDARFISGLFLIALVWGTVQLYRLLPIGIYLRTLSESLGSVASKKQREQKGLVEH